MELVTGLKGERRLVVSPRHLSSATGNFGSDVLSTHEVVLLMELAAREAILGCLPDGMITVGTRVDVRHTAAAPLGAEVTARARLEEIRGRVLLFFVKAEDRFGTLAAGENEQRIVSRAGFHRHVRRRTA